MISNFLKSKFFAIIFFVAIFNAVNFTVAGILFQSNHQAFSIAVLSYVVGLKHAMDADHIAAIDNVTRSLISKGQKPATVGFFFSLGHSTVVLITLLIIVVSLASIDFNQYELVSSFIGPIVSATFLFIIGTVNCISLYYTYKSIQVYNEEAQINENGIIDNVTTAHENSTFPSIRHVNQSQTDTSKSLFPAIVDTKSTDTAGGRHPGSNDESYNIVQPTKYSSPTAPFRANSRH